MSDTHLSRSLLQSLVEGRGDAGDLTPRTLAHLFALCPHCRQVFRAFQEELEEAGMGWEAPASWAALEGALGAEAPHDTEEDRAAGAPTAAPLKAPSIPTSREAARGAGHDCTLVPVLELAPKLLAAARGHLPGHPREALALSDLARTTLQHIPSSQPALAFCARSVASMADALHAAGELTTAGELLAHARYLLTSHGIDHRRLSAELDQLEGSLRRDQGRLGEAAELLERALLAYRLDGEIPEVARCLLHLAGVRREQGELEEALHLNREALSLVPAGEDPRLTLYASFSLAQLLSAAGRQPDARQQLLALIPMLQRSPDPYLQLHTLWLEGHIARGLNEHGAAGEAYEAARQGFLKAEMPYDAALATLDLGCLELERGHPEEVERLGRELRTLSRDRRLHRPTATALRWLSGAAHRRQLTVADLREVAAYLRAARHDPGLTLRAFRKRP